MVDVVVVGAGAAGLAAAAALQQAGKTVQLLEARRRVGGRIWTSRAYGSIVEHGAEFIHGHNPIVAELLAQQRIATQTWAPAQLAAYGNTIYSPALMQVLSDLNDRFWDSLLDYAGPDMSLAAFIDGHFVGTAGRVLLGAMVRDTEGADVSIISTSQLRDSLSDANDDLAGAARVPVAGYRKLLHQWAANAPIAFNQEVVTVTAKGKHMVVKTAAGTSWTARAVIVTLPLGVLQAGTVDFAPGLPAPVASSLQAIGLGKSVKVQLHFTKDVLQFENLHTDQLVGSWWRPLHQPKDGSVIYSGLAGGSPAEFLASVDKQAAVHACVEDLASLFGSAVLHAFAGGVITDWIHDPYTRGGYSFNQIGTTEDNREILAEPVIPGQLIFAGEALPANRWNYGTVHGSIESGVRAVRRLIAA